MRQYFVTTSGSSGDLEVLDEGGQPNTDADYVSLNLSSTGHPDDKVRVLFMSPTLIAHAIQVQAGLSYDSELKKTVAILATLNQLNQNPDFREGSEPERVIQIGAGEILHLLEGLDERLSDPELRRYIARVVHQNYTRTHLSDELRFDEGDRFMTGATPLDFHRACQLLAEEGSLVLVSDEWDVHSMPTVRATAKLVRDVERYGAAQEDVISEGDYAAKVAAYAELEEQRAYILDERRRYALASTEDELTSVFRAVAPVVENVARRLLTAHGAKGSHKNLGVIIGALQSRQIGNERLWGKLNTVHSWGRDESLHGHGVSQAVLRVLCENAFELLTELADLFPRKNAAHVTGSTT